MESIATGLGFSSVNSMLIVVVVLILVATNYNTWRGVFVKVFSWIGKSSWINWTDKAADRITDVITADDDIEACHQMVQKIILRCKKLGMPASEEMARGLGKSLYDEHPQDNGGE